jgi:hypothetical protein
MENKCLNVLVARGENEGYVIQADEVWFGNSTRGHFVSVVFVGVFYFMPRRLMLRHGLHIAEASRLHAHTPHSLGLLRTSDQSDEVTATYTTHSTHKRHTHAPGGIWTHSHSKRANTGMAPLLDMQAWTIAVDENGYRPTLRVAWELPSVLVDENGYDFEGLHWRWTKTDIPFHNLVTCTL